MEQAPHSIFPPALWAKQTEGQPSSYPGGECGISGSDSLEQNLRQVYNSRIILERKKQKAVQPLGSSLPFCFKSQPQSPDVA